MEIYHVGVISLVVNIAILKGKPSGLWIPLWSKPDQAGPRSPGSRPGSSFLPADLTGSSVWTSKSMPAWEWRALITSPTAPARNVFLSGDLLITTSSLWAPRLTTRTFSIQGDQIFIYIYKSWNFCIFLSSKVDIFGTGITKAEIDQKIQTIVMTQFKSIEECAR